MWTDLFFDLLSSIFGKQADEKRSLELLQQTLEWRHLAPTAPDTLSCYPFCDTDPFVLDSCPHVYFVGNQVGD